MLAQKRAPICGRNVCLSDVYVFYDINKLELNWPHAKLNITDIIFSLEIIEKLLLPETDFWHDNYLNIFNKDSWTYDIFLFKVLMLFTIKRMVKSNKELFISAIVEESNHREWLAIEIVDRNEKFSIPGG